MLNFIKDLLGILPADVELASENDRAFCQIAQGAIVSDTTFPSGFKSPKATDKYEWYIDGCRLKARPRK